MSEKPLLLSSAKSVVVHTSPHAKRLRFAAICIGLFVVLVGAASVASILATDVLGPNASLDIFAPAVTLTDPNALNAAKYKPAISSP